MLEIFYLFYLLGKDIENKIENTSCLATNIYHEARGESVEGQIAVGNVVINRVNSNYYPNTICEVVKQAKYDPVTTRLIRHKCQFSWYCDGKSDEPKDVEIFLQIFVLSSQILAGRFDDNTHGSTHYFNPKKANPYWAVNFRKTVKYDNHEFYKGD